MRNDLNRVSNACGQSGFFGTTRRWSISRQVIVAAMAVVIFPISLNAHDLEDKPMKADWFISSIVDLAMIDKKSDLGGRSFADFVIDKLYIHKDKIIVWNRSNIFSFINPNDKKNSWFSLIRVGNIWELDSGQNGIFPSVEIDIQNVEKICVDENYIKLKYGLLVSNNHLTATDSAIHHSPFERPRSDYSINDENGHLNPIQSDGDFNLNITLGKRDQKLNEIEVIFNKRRCAKSIKILKSITEQMKIR